MAKKGYIPWNDGTSKTKLTFICEYCNTEHTKYLYGRDFIRFCSNKCAHEKMKHPTLGKHGHKHPKWKEKKLTPFRKQLRFTYEYKNWRNDIFIRDDYTCNLCGIRGNALEVHHITPFATILDTYEIDTYENQSIVKNYGIQIMV